MTAVYPILGGDFEHGGSASRAVKEQLKQVGADPAVVRRAMIAAYEAEMNVVIHAHGGELRASLDNGQLDVEILDTGPGIPDIGAAMREGFSTASAKARELGFGAGMGLPNIKRNSDTFELESGAGRGTRVHFTIALRPQALYGNGRHSIRVIAEKCRQSLQCVRVCPTQAIRVFRGKPEILDYLCVDCGACIAACPTGAIAMQAAEGPRGPGAECRGQGIKESKEHGLASAADVLVVPAAVFAQYGAGISPERVAAEIAALTGAQVLVLGDWEAALRMAIDEYAELDTDIQGRGNGADGAVSRPVISPACPAVVNLIETRFPSLIPHVAPFVSASEAARSDLPAEAQSRRTAAFVVNCPAQRTALLADGAAPQPQVFSPADVRTALMPQLAQRSEPDAEAQGQAAEREEVGARVASLRVTGLRHVLHVLNAIEDGLVSDVDVVEPWVCDQGCFGSPLLAEDPFLAQRRWDAEPLMGGYAWTATGPANVAAARAVRRTRAFEARKGLRLDNDMSKAIQKLARIDKLRRTLPGSDCGMCGAPTCAALAEDIVLGRAAADACVRQQNSPGGPGVPENKP